MPDEESLELVKAAAEGTTKGAIEALVQPVAGFLGKLCGGPAEELGGWVTDVLAFKRWKSRVRMLRRAEEFLHDAGLEAHQVPLPVLVPILDAGANEEDESMADRWAALLANAAAEPDSVPPSFPSFLEQLSPQDAVLLDGIYVDSMRDIDPTRDRGTAVLGLKLPISDVQRVLGVDNLIRLGLCLPQRVNTPGTINENRTVLYLTELGRAFVEKCKAPAATYARA